MHLIQINSGDLFLSRFKLKLELISLLFSMFGSIAPIQFGNLQCYHAILHDRNSWRYGLQMMLKANVDILTISYSPISQLLRHLISNIGEFSFQLEFVCVFCPFD